MKTNAVLASASPELRNNVFIEGDTLFAADPWKGEDELNSLYSRAKRLNGVKKIIFMKSGDFRKRYGNTLQDSGSSSDLQKEAVKLIQEAYDLQASDIHIADMGTQGVIKLRCFGMLREHAVIPGTKCSQLISVIYSTMCQQGSTTSHTPSVRQDARIARREYLPANVHSIRVHTEPIECAEAAGGNGCLMLLRLLYDRTEAKGSMAERLNKLGYSPADIQKIRALTLRSGTKIISGPTGHGKSTLLKHIMEAQAEESPEKAYQSIEDPPEYPLAGVSQIMVNTGKILSDPKERQRSYIDAIAGAMRSDPDVLMIGEIRFGEAASATIDVALTGHGAWATIHANNAIGIIKRMVSLLNSAEFDDPLEYLCDPNVLAGLIYQRLVPYLCNSCKRKLSALSEEERKTAIPDETYARLQKVLPDLDGIFVHNANGCESCSGSGFSGMTVTPEIIVTDHQFLHLIRLKKEAEAYEYWLQHMEGNSFIQSAIGKIAAGILDPYTTEIRLGVPLDFDPANVGTSDLATGAAS